jgi:hypothetical protein
MSVALVMNVGLAQPVAIGLYSLEHTQVDHRTGSVQHHLLADQFSETDGLVHIDNPAANGWSAQTAKL